MAKGELKERARILIIGRRQINTTIKQIRAIIISAILAVPDFTTAAPYQIPRSPNFFARALAVNRKITHTTD